MRILHTSDWHIGKKIYQQSRLNEQSVVLNEIVDVCNSNNVDLVLIAGDIFDTFTPSAECEQLFYNILSKLANENRAVVIISGNHDDSNRLCAPNSISTLSNVYFLGIPYDNVILPKSNNLNVFANEINTSYIIIQKGNEKVYIGALPYPTELRLKEKIDDSEGYEEKVSRWINKCFEQNKNNLPQILLTHLFMLGGEGTEGERNIELGGTRIVSKKAIPENCIYTALGHLHKRQIVDTSRNIYYCGSPMQFSFDECSLEKSVNIFDVVLGKVENFKNVIINSGIKLYRINANSLDEGEKLINNIGSSGYFELTLTLDKPLNLEDRKEFCKNHPNVFIKLLFKGDEVYSSKRREMDDKTLFCDYYLSRYGSKPSKEIVDLFLSLLSDNEVSE